MTSYPMLMVAIDPYTSESSWILDTAADLLHHYSPADVRVAWLVAADDERVYAPQPVVARGLLGLEFQLLGGP